MRGPFTDQIYIRYHPENTIISQFTGRPETYVELLYKNRDDFVIVSKHVRLMPLQELDLENISHPGMLTIQQIIHLSFSS